MVRGGHAGPDRGRDQADEGDHAGDADAGAGAGVSGGYRR